MQITDVKTGVEVLIEAIKTDYRDWSVRGGMNETRQNMVAEFETSLGYTEGSKYIKVTRDGGSVWGFVVKKDDGKFKAGDILKAAGWNAPARNKARGNVFNGYRIQWTGPNYLV